MFLGGVSREAFTELVVFARGTFTAVRYVEEVLSQNVVVFAGFSPEFILMLDNCRPHTAVIMHEYWNEIGISVM